MPPSHIDGLRIGAGPRSIPRKFQNATRKLCSAIRSDPCPSEVVKLRMAAEELDVWCEEAQLDGVLLVGVRRPRPCAPGSRLSVESVRPRNESGRTRDSDRLQPRGYGCRVAPTMN
jgi:hypothetical protein